MAYSEPIQIVYASADSNGLVVETGIEDTGIAGSVLIPCDVELLGWGVYVTEDFVVHTTVPAITIGTMNDSADTTLDTNLDTITLDSSATAALKAGDGTKQGQTAISASTDIDLGDTILAHEEDFPMHIAGGKFLAWEMTTPATSAGGAFVPFAIIRVNGLPDPRGASVWVATTNEAVAA